MSVNDIPEELRAVVADLGITEEHMRLGGETTAAMLAMSSAQAEMALETMMRAASHGPGLEMVRRQVFGFMRAYCRAYAVTPEELFRQVFQE